MEPIEFSEGYINFKKEQLDGLIKRRNDAVAKMEKFFEEHIGNIEVNDYKVSTPKPPGW